MPQAVLGSIGLRESRLLPDGSQRITSRDARTRLLEGLADARALLVLDNCEHLIDACAHLADALLAHSPRLRIVATSREPLGITGESLFVVPPLGEDPAVRLFADRAAAVSPDFTLDGETRRWSPTSSGGSTACRWRSSSPPPGCGRCRWPRSPGG